MIVLRDVELRRGVRTLMSGVNVTINPGEKVGLVGRNGAGKSTLFALLNGQLQEEKGEVEFPAHWRLSQVEQHMPESEDSASEFVLASDIKLAQAQEHLRIAELSDDGMAIAESYMALSDAGAHDALSRAQSLILGLGFKTQDLDKPVNSFSGGWRMRLQLARALMCPSDLMLLDEPTNHLDLDALVWLESWLQRYPGTLIMISHDREFLDAVTRITLHIENGQITRYGANYSGFETMRAQELILQQAAFEKQQDKISHLQHFIDRFKAKASKAKQAQSRVKALERMEKIAPMMSQADFTFAFKDPVHLPNPMVAIQGGDFGYHIDDQATIILDKVSRSVLSGQRIGILGANGQGKSTFVKTLAQAIPLLSGEITQGKGLSIGYFAQQELDVLELKQSPLEHMIELAKKGPIPGREQEIRNFLGTFKFADQMVNQAVGTLSGGEKARLVLAMIVWQRPNLLLLDEPTNHLDLMTREALGMAINDFEGTVLLVSHDRALLRSVCEEFWLVSRSGITDFKGDMDEYQKYLLEESKKLRDTQAPSSASSQAAPAVNMKGLSRQEKKLESQKKSSQQVHHQTLKKELQAIESNIQHLEVQKHALLEKMAQASIPQGASAEQTASRDVGMEMAKSGKALRQVEQSLNELEEKWLEVSQALEGQGLLASPNA
jgi:ATP-binding cassette subfamily F protein 3